MDSTRDLDALPNKLSLRMRSVFFCSPTVVSQCESRVFVSLIRAPAFMILDEYGAEAAHPRVLSDCLRPPIRAPRKNHFVSRSAVNRPIAPRLVVLPTQQSNDQYRGPRHRRQLLAI